MAKQTVNVGASPNDNSGDSIRVAFQKINANFTELYDSLGIGDGGAVIENFEFANSTISTTDSTSITIDQATTVTSDLTVGGDLYARNIRSVNSTSGLKQVYIDPTTGEFVFLD